MREAVQKTVWGGWVEKRSGCVEGCQGWVVGGFRAGDSKVTVWVGASAGCAGELERQMVTC